MEQILEFLIDAVYTSIYTIDVYHSRNDESASSEGIRKHNFLHPPVPQWQRIGEMDEIRALILSISFAPRGIEDHACFDGWL